MRLLTNFARFPADWSVSTGESGPARIVSRFREFARYSREFDLLLINGDVGLVYKLCAFFLLCPWRRRPIVAVDLVLSKPEGIYRRTLTFGKKTLLTRVDHFINYFKYSDGYAKFYGITPERSSFVHFKPNIRYRQELVTCPDGEYILCFGRSRRDYDTFFRAIETLPYPAAIPKPNRKALAAHGSRFTYSLDRLPPQVKLLEDDGSEQSMIQIIQGARIVALPMLASNLLAGVGVYLNAMLMRKCIVITTGAGVSDVLSDEALFVPPGDPDALAATIRSAWENDALRLQTAEKGYRHAFSLGGEPELRQRILESVFKWLNESQSAD